ncbi:MULTISPECIES: hypothetical protein [Microvirga]|uniref:hypothetical protein n=1 Tax=Microvirga TaxID=186650 RepID=UPI001CFFD275|nr:hypothetical protein [Microvirga lenta]MCB5175284.1 hypothetical protein [Microvirga lenta]
MALSRSRLLYIAAMIVTGVVIGWVAAQNPTWQEAAITPAAWPFVVSLVLDIVIGQAAARGKAEPLTMGDRFVGVLGAGLIVTAFLAIGT